MKPIAIDLAIANAKERIDPLDVMRFLEENADDIETFERAPPPPGTIRMAAIDYVLLLGVGGSLASIASLLWMAYDKFVAPMKGEDDNAGIVVMVRRPNGSSESMWIGNEFNDHDIFVREFEARVTAIQSADTGDQRAERFVAQLRSREMWIRRK